MPLSCRDSSISPRLVLPGEAGAPATARSVETRTWKYSSSIADTRASQSGQIPFSSTTSGIKEPRLGAGVRASSISVPGLILSASIVGSGRVNSDHNGRCPGRLRPSVACPVQLCGKGRGRRSEFARWTIATGTPAITGYQQGPTAVRAHPAGSIYCSSC